MRKQLDESIHDPANDKCRDGGAKEGQSQYRSNVPEGSYNQDNHYTIIWLLLRLDWHLPEEKPFLHAVSGVKDNGRQKDVKENLRIERCFLQKDIQVRGSLMDLKQDGGYLVNLVDFLHVLDLSLERVSQRFIHQPLAGFFT